MLTCPTLSTGSVEQLRLDAAVLVLRQAGLQLLHLPLPGAQAAHQQIYQKVSSQSQDKVGGKNRKLSWFFKFLLIITKNLYCAKYYWIHFHYNIFTSYIHYPIMIEQYDFLVSLLPVAHVLISFCILYNDHEKINIFRVKNE